MRRALATGAGKTTAILSRRLKRGGGTTLPGAVAGRIDPHLLSGLTARLPAGCVIITGTNGKTTTARMVASILEAAGHKPVHNRSGANLIDGLSSALLSATDLLGRPRGDIGVFEVDEATIPQAVAQARPRALVVTNLFRDQLDRYGEIDHIATLWREAVAALPATSVAVLNADDPVVAGLGTVSAAPVVYYGLEDRRHGLARLQHTADSKHCLYCGAPYRYDTVYYSHVGHYTCPRCGAVRPAPSIYAETVALHEAEGSDLRLQLPGGPLQLRLSLPGLYNVYNALAAVACSAAVGVPEDQLRAGLEGLPPAFGRLERVPLGERGATLALVKNPVGFDQVLHMLLLSEEPKDLIIAINDNLADGTDISWLWDVDFEALAGRVGSVCVAGTRAEDMLVRLKYALVDVERVTVEKDPHRALSGALERVPPGGDLYVLPTYTAMLEVRRAIASVGNIARFWED